MSKKLAYRPRSAGYSTGQRRATQRWWASRKVWDTIGGMKIITFSRGLKHTEAYIIDTTLLPVIYDEAIQFAAADFNHAQDVFAQTRQAVMDKRIIHLTDITGV